MTHYLNRGPIITVSDPLYPGQYKQFRNPDWNELPEIISFTEFLRWNYTVDYGQYIRELHRNGRLPLLYGIPPTAAIENVAVVEGKYDRIDHFTFLMYVICDVIFVVNGYRQNQKYCVLGYYKANGRSDFFSDIDLYTGKYIRCQNPLDEFLVPILSKRDFDKVAEQIVEEYYPYETNFQCRINGIALAEAMGYNVRYARLSLNGKVKSKIIFEKKDVTVYDKDGHKELLSVEKTTIFVDDSLKNMADEQNAVIHECVHAHLHNLFYNLQSYYHYIVGKESPEFNDYFYSNTQQKCMKWMKTQANSIARHIQMPKDETSDVIIDYLDRIDREPDFEDYRGLIDFVKYRFGVSRYAAKKRIIELGWNEVCGVYVYCTTGYVEDYEVAYDFPDDSTYTVPFSSIAELFGRSVDFQALVKSGKYVYVDGHICLNNEKYIITKYNLPSRLTEYARHHMSECCIDFKKVYDKLTYSYTFGELNKEELAIIENYVLDEYQKSKLKARLTEIADTKDKLDHSPLGEAVVYHMKRCHLTSEQLMERSGLGSTTITKLRSGKCHPKLETILAFCVALNLEDVFRSDLMNKAGVRFNNNNPAHLVYMTILELMPDANVFQINAFLKEEGYTPWTQDRQNAIAAAI